MTSLILTDDSSDEDSVSEDSSDEEASDEGEDVDTDQSIPGGKGRAPLELVCGVPGCCVKGPST